MDDTELLRQYIGTGSEPAFAELVRRHVDIVFSAALRQVGGDHHRAKDVTQMVFTDLARKAGALSRHPLLIGWLYRSTHYAASLVRREERRQRALEQVAAEVADFDQTGGEADWSRFRPVLDDAMNALSERDRQAVLLRFFANQPFAEIGQRLGLNENTARMRVERALDKLQTLLARRGVTSTSSALATALSSNAVTAAPFGLTMTVAEAAMTAVPPLAIAAGAIGFMSTTKSTVAIIGSVLLIAALGIAFHESHRREVAEKALSFARQDYDQYLASERAVEAKAQAVEQVVSQLKTGAEEARRAQIAATPPAARLAASDPVAKGDAFMARHPEVRRALNDYARAKWEFRYGPIFQALHLSPAQIAEFKDLWPLQMGAEGLDGESISLKSGNGTPDRDLPTRLKELFGEDGLQQFGEASTILDARQIAVSLASALYFTEAPLTPDQADAIIPIIATSRLKSGKGKSQEFDWDAVMTKSAGILSGLQLAAIEGLKANDAFVTALNTPVVAPSATAKGK